MVILKELANRSIARLTKQLSIELHIGGGTEHTHAATGTHLGRRTHLIDASTNGNVSMSLATAHARVPISTIPCPHGDLIFSLMRLSPPRRIISNTHPDPNEHCIGHQTTHNDHANHDSTPTRARTPVPSHSCDKHADNNLL
jgi:hypothetical protein